MEHPPRDLGRWQVRRANFLGSNTETVNGQRITSNGFMGCLDEVERAEPVTETMPGWEEDIRGVKSLDELPDNCRRYIERLEALAGRQLRLLEVPNRFFGGNTAVAGLMVGEDVKRAIVTDDQPAGAYVLPDVALSGDMFIDEVPLSEVAASTDTPLVVAPATAAGMLGAAR